MSDFLDEAISAVKLANGQTGNVHFVAAILKAVASGELVHAALIREAEARGMERACLAVSERSEWPEDEHGRTEQPALFARVINAIRAEAAALKGETT